MINPVQCDLELLDLFDTVEQGVFFGIDFLVNRTAIFHFHVVGYPVSLSPANECTDTAATCANERLLLYI